MKNLEGFLSLTVMLGMCNVVLAVPGEVLNLIANHKEYTAALLILITGLICCFIGASLFKCLKQQIKKEF